MISFSPFCCFVEIETGSSFTSATGGSGVILLHLARLMMYMVLQNKTYGFVTLTPQTKSYKQNLWLCKLVQNLWLCNSYKAISFVLQNHTHHKPRDVLQNDPQTSRCWGKRTSSFDFNEAILTKSYIQLRGFWDSNTWPFKSDTVLPNANGSPSLWPFFEISNVARAQWREDGSGKVVTRFDVIQRV